MISNIVSSDLLKTSLSILPLWLESQWQQRVGVSAENNGPKKLYVDVVGSLAQIKRSAADKVGQLTGPYAGIVIAEMALNRNRFNNYALKRHGVEAGRSENRQRVRFEHLASVNVGLGLRFVCNDKNDQIMFSSILLEQAAKGTLGFMLKNPLGFSFECSLNFSDNVSHGDQDSEDNKGNFVLETTIILSTFSGTIQEIGVIKGIEFGMAPSDYVDNQAADSSLNPEDFVGYAVPEITKLSYIDKYDTTSPHHWEITST